MSYQYRFCPTCATQRAATDHRCRVCGGPVRHASHSLAVAAPTDPGAQPPFTAGWRRLTAADAELAVREARD
ncbi:MAG: hypothetical protein HY690_16850 [Chloroflexi bacterium]|nr:hypothetical protein [Chloroflexota bacterium]